jgi:hypothetical protein
MQGQYNKVGFIKIRRGSYNGLLPKKGKERKNKGKRERTKQKRKNKKKRKNRKKKRKTVREKRRKRFLKGRVAVRRRDEKSIFLF